MGGPLSQNCIPRERGGRDDVPAPVLTREREREKKRKELLGGTSEWWL